MSPCARTGNDELATAILKEARIGWRRFEAQLGRSDPRAVVKLNVDDSAVLLKELSDVPGCGSLGYAADNDDGALLEVPAGGDDGGSL